MKTKYIYKGILAALFMAFTVSSCDGYEVDLINDLLVDRAFAPVGVTARVRNQINVELNWTVKEGVDHYVIEFSADDPDFNVIEKTVEVTPDQLPLTVTLDGETVYSIRVKAVSSTGLEDSKWSVVTATTLSEQNFLAIQPGDIQAKQATFRWIPNINVTELLITPGDIRHTITPDEKLAGIATVTGLVGQTAYTVQLLNGTKKRGIQAFTTLIDIGNGILVSPTDDLNAIVAAATSGDILVLEAGDYTAYVGEIILNKSLTIRGLLPYDKPKLHVKFTITTGTSNLSLIDLDLDGGPLTTGLNSSLMTISGANTNYGDILVSGCNVHDFERSLIAANAASSKVNSYTVDNSIVKNVNTNAGADFIDFRNTYVATLTVKNSTFDTCSASRDFIRVDAVAAPNGFSGTGLTTNVLVDSNTLYNVSNLANVPTVAPKRLLYVRFSINASIVRNNLVAETSATWSNQSTTTLPVYSANYYFNAPYPMADVTIVSGNKPDASGTVANPQFVSAATGNFKIQNQTLIDNLIGDPRWRN